MPEPTATPHPLDSNAVLDGLRQLLPVAIEPADLSVGRTGLILVDPVVGFTTRGPMSDAASMQPMVATLDGLCRQLLGALGERLAIFVFRDHHGPDQREPPYPAHCQEGSGEELLDPRLAWLEGEPRAVVWAKDCINGVIGALEAVGEDATNPSLARYRNHLVEWIANERLDRLLVAGDCTDICVMDFVVAVLSVRNHGMLGAAQERLPVLVYEPGCATYDLPDPLALGLPETARHPRLLAHHAALYFMQSRGARIVGRLTT